MWARVCTCACARACVLGPLCCSGRFPPPSLKQPALTPAAPVKGEQERAAARGGGGTWVRAPQQHQAAPGLRSQETRSITASGGPSTCAGGVRSSAPQGRAEGRAPELPAQTWGDSEREARTNGAPAVTWGSLGALGRPGAAGDGLRAVQSCRTSDRAGRSRVRAPGWERLALSLSLSHTHTHTHTRARARRRQGRTASSGSGERAVRLSSLQLLSHEAAKATGTLSPGATELRRHTGERFLSGQPVANRVA